MATSPTELTLKKLRKDGYVAAKTEHWNPFGGNRKDLFGFVDCLGIKEKETLAVQATTKSNMAARVRKILDHENGYAVTNAWTVEVWGWYKEKNRWKVSIQKVKPVIL